MIPDGIEITYTADPNDLNPETLAKYDALLIYANHTTIAPEQEKALLDFVASGKGFLPIHSASYCFQNSPAYIALVGAQFLRHGTMQRIGLLARNLAEGVAVGGGDHALVERIDLRLQLGNLH